MTETPKQRDERRAKVANSVQRDFDDPSWEHLQEHQREYWREVVRAIAVSDEAAGMVTVPKELLHAMRNVTEGEPWTVKAEDLLAAYEEQSDG